VFHVLTVHWYDDKWIEPQLRYLERFLPEHRVYGCLNGIDPKWNNRFYYTCDLDGPHSPKLNALAEIAREHASDDDYFLFLDGDAFPIGPVTPALLGDTKLVAIRRDENLGEAQPHPAFCITPVGFWFDIGGDWKLGYTWTASNGEQVTDGGGNLLGILTENDIPWKPLLRTNRFDLDPLWFGVYGDDTQPDVVYHHGAGFRPMKAIRDTVPAKVAIRQSIDKSVIPASVPVLGKLERSARYRLARRHERRKVDELAAESQKLSDEVFSWIETDDDFARRFMDPTRHTS
jgi:hypothetical protein